MQFAQMIKLERKKRKLTQAQMASIIGTAERQYRRYETGENDPPLTIACRIADAMGVSLDYLCGRLTD